MAPAGKSDTIRHPHRFKKKLLDDRTVLPTDRCVIAFVAITVAVLDGCDDKLDKMNEKRSDYSLHSLRD